MSTPLNVIFAGTPEFAAVHLQAVIDSEHSLRAVYTQPDRPAGRGRKLTASPVKELALVNHLPVYQPETLKSPQAMQQMASLNADILVVVAYGLILPEEILKIPLMGCINIHASLLPRWRGAAPIQRAIEADDKETGITIMQMDAGLDTGDMLFKSKISINKDETAASLHDRLMDCGAKSLIKALQAIAAGKLNPERQDNSKASYAVKLSKQESSIDWSLDMDMIGRKIRAFTPWPGSSVSMEGIKMKVLAEPVTEDYPDAKPQKMNDPGKIISADKKGLRVACQKGSLLITSIQIPGKKMIPVASLLNSYQDQFKTGRQFDL